MTTTDTPGGIDRRTFLRATGGAAVASAAIGTTTGSATAAPGDDLSSWFEGVSNYDGVADRRGNDRVYVRVGAPGNGGGFAFEPAAIQVDPGTTVVWEWTGEGGAHNVADTDDAYGSKLLSDAGATFEHVFGETVVSKYVCVPHESMGMKGAVIVGDQDLGAGGQAFVEPDFGGWFDNVSNFEGTVDATGKEEVQIAVGAEGNGSAFAFDPASIHVDPGTTVVWKWTGEGGAHNVYDDEVGYESDMLSAAGSTFALTFDGTGVSTYACAPHETMGMKGAVVVGNPYAASGGGLSTEAKTGVLGLVFLAVLSPLVAAALLPRRRDDVGPSVQAR